MPGAAGWHSQQATSNALPLCPPFTPALALTPWGASPSPPPPPPHLQLAQQLLHLTPPPLTCSLRSSCCTLCSESICSWRRASFTLTEPLFSAMLSVRGGGGGREEGSFTSQSRDAVCEGRGQGGEGGRAGPGEGSGGFERKPLPQAALLSAVRSCKPERKPSHKDMSPSPKPSHKDMNPSPKPSHKDMNPSPKPSHKDMNPKVLNLSNPTLLSAEQACLQAHRMHAYQRCVMVLSQDLNSPRCTGRCWP